MKTETLPVHSTQFSFGLSQISSKTIQGPSISKIHEELLLTY